MVSSGFSVLVSLFGLPSRYLEWYSVRIFLNCSEILRASLCRESSIVLSLTPSVLTIMLVLLIPLLLFDILWQLQSLNLMKIFRCLGHLLCYRKRFALELNMASLFLLKVILCFFCLIPFSNGLFVRAVSLWAPFLSLPDSAFGECSQFNLTFCFIIKNFSKTSNFKAAIFV